MKDRQEQKDPIVQRVWEKGSLFSAQIDREKEQEEVMICGNREGLITLARVFLFLAQHPEEGDRAVVNGEVKLVFTRKENGEI